MEEIVLEQIMFQSPPEWGRRIVKRENEIILQATDDRGVTWTDQPIPEVKLVLPSEMRLKSSGSSNKSLCWVNRRTTARKNGLTGIN